MAQQGNDIVIMNDNLDTPRNNEKVTDFKQLNENLDSFGSFIPLHIVFNAVHR